MKQTKVRYVGPHLEGVLVPMPHGGEQFVPVDGELTVDDDYAQLLLAQPSNWQPVEKPAVKKKAGGHDGGGDPDGGDAEKKEG